MRERVCGRTGQSVSGWLSERPGGWANECVGERVDNWVAMGGLCRLQATAADVGRDILGGRAVLGAGWVL